MGQSIVHTVPSKYLLQAVALIIAVAVCWTLLPAVLHAQASTDTTAQALLGLVPCGNDITVSGNAQSGYTYSNECTVCHLQILAQKVLNWFILIMVALAALMFAYAGLMYLTASGNPGNVAAGHRALTNTLIGLIIILAAYLLIDTVMKTLLSGDDGNVNGFGPWNEILCEGGVQDSYTVPGLKPVELDASDTDYTTGGGF